MHLNLETVARGLGFTEKKGDIEYVMWRRVDKYLEELHFGTSAERPDYIPENIFYRLACAVCADANASLMGVQGVRLRFFLSNSVRLCRRSRYS